MATTTVETHTLNVVLQDNQLNEMTLKLNNPISGATRASVLEVFGALLAGGESNTSGKTILYSKFGYPISAIGSTQLISTLITKKDLE